MKLLNKVLVANRGEIAVRIIRTLKLMGIRSVAVFSAQDKNALHVRMADEAYDLVGSELNETYLNIPEIIRIALQSGSDGIHSGYGFLSENPDFSKAAADAGINFIGPTSQIIQLMGNKTEARKTMLEIGIPMIDGITGDLNDIRKRSNELRYPLLVKAAAGGGGKAMRIVNNPASLNETLEITAREAQNYFGNPMLFVERYMPDARHIEVQIIADHYGNMLILGDRECSVQRRYQKVIEEAPAISLSQKTRDEIYNTVKKIAGKIDYINAGTFEFLVDPEGNHFFLEMNTRIQVEHAVTEMVTGIDIVELQVQIAAGNKLELQQSEIKISGHAIEARVYAEDPEKMFLPSPGIINRFSLPALPGLRIDSGFDGPDTLFPDYDPLIAKFIFHGKSRDEAIDGLVAALENFVLQGPQSNREFLIEILNDSDFRKNKISTRYLETVSESLNINLIRKKAEFDRIRLYSAYIAWMFWKEKRDDYKNVWTSIGGWRALINKSFLYNETEVMFTLENLTAGNITFSIKGESYTLSLIRKINGTIVFDMNGIWSSGSCSVSESGEESIFLDGMDFKIKALDSLPLKPDSLEKQLKTVNGIRHIKSPLHGKIAQIYATSGQSIKKGDFLFSLDAMKIENKITSLYDGCLKEVLVKAGEQVKINQTIMIIE